MKYADLRHVARSGDVLLVEGQGLISRFIRAVTGQNISHVAVLVWFGNTLWVAEMKEFVGYRLRPASLWVDDALTGSIVYYGAAPASTLDDAGIHKTILQYRNRQYSYKALFRVWLAQLLRKKMNAGLVCSTFVQRVWEACGIEFKQTADPGDYMRLCSTIQSIQGESL